MKIQVLLFLFFTNTAISQIKSFNLSGTTHLNLIYSTLNTYSKSTDSVLKTAYNIYGDSMIQMGSITIKTVEDGSSQFSTLDISQIDTAFNLITELKDKVYLISRSNYKDCYFLKDNKILVRKVLQKSHIWNQVDYDEYKIYKIDFGNNRIVYWANDLGIIYKQKKEFKTIFLPLEYFYKYNNQEIPGNRSEISVRHIDSVDMETDYFEFGSYRIVKKKNNKTENNYVVLKDKQVVFDELCLKYYNSKTLMTYNKGILTFYNVNLKIDSQFHFRQIYEGWDNLEFLIKNQIKKIPVRDYVQITQNNIRGVCGTVVHYNLKLNKNKAILNADREIVGEKSTIDSIPLISKFGNDSILFITHLKEMSWSENGGFNDQLILFKNGKQGLYKYLLKDTLFVLKEILPIEFNSIRLLNGNLVINKNGNEDFLNYFIENRKLRFKQLTYEKCSYLRYRKSNDKKGWIDSKGLLFDDSK